MFDRCSKAFLFAAINAFLGACSFEQGQLNEDLYDGSLIGDAGTTDAASIDARPPSVCSAALLEPDDFSAPELKPQWETFGFDTVVSLVDEAIRVEFDSVARYRYGGVRSVNNELSLKNKRIAVEMSQLSSPSQEHVAYLQFVNRERDQSLEFLLRDREMLFLYRPDADTFDFFTNAKLHNAATQNYIQLRESNDVVYFEAGSDPGAMEIMTSFPLDTAAKRSMIIDGQVAIYATATAGASSPNATVFDNYNIDADCIEP